MKNVFIDCGAHAGLSVDYFLKNFPDSDTYEIHSFECSPTIAKDLKKYMLKYSMEFENGLKTIRYNYENTIPNDIVIRPSRTDNSKFASYINIDHPNDIKNHPNYLN